MSREITIRFPEMKSSATAALIESDAPLASELVWGLLGTAFAGVGVHAMYAGPAVLVAVPARHGEPCGGQIPSENETVGPAPGDILLLPPDPEASVRGDDSGVTIAIFYGDEGRPFAPQGWVPGVRVGRVIEGLAELREACGRMRLEGATAVRLGRVEAAVAPESAVLHADGSSLGNPGPAGAGFVLETEDGRLLAEGAIPLAPATVNVAEYRALIGGLAEAQRLGVRRVRAIMDSQLVCRHLSGQYRVKSASLRPLYERARELLGHFEEASCEHVPREMNARADELAGVASRQSKERLRKNAD